MKFAGEVFKRAAGLSLSQANHIANQLLPKYEEQLGHAPRGLSFGECYDTSSLKPKGEWQTTYETVTRTRRSRQAYRSTEPAWSFGSASRVDIPRWREFPFQGGKPTVRRLVRKRKALLVIDQAGAFIPLEFGPGQDAEFDFGEAQVILAGQELTAQYVVMDRSGHRFAAVKAQLP